MNGVVAIVPSAGAGRRFGASKTFAELRGKPVIIWTLQMLQGVDEIVEIIPVMRADEMERGLELIERYGITKVKKVAPGGEERQHSVYIGIGYIERPVSSVLIHDGVRPLVTADLIRTTIRHLRGYDGVMAGVSLKDTVKVVEDGVVKGTLRRDALVAVQTPQVFRKKVLVEAYKAVIGTGMNFTDDSAIVEHYGGRVRVVEGDYRNIKITTPEDIAVAEAYLSL